VAPEPGLIRRAILTPLAVSRGLDYEMEFMVPGSSEDAQAYGFVSCGADLLLDFTYDEGFPSQDRRTTKRGVKWVLEGVSGEGGQRAAIYLAQAFALGMEWAMKWAGNDESAKLQQGFRQLIQRRFPLGDDDLTHLGELDVLHRIMETHEVPDAIRARLGVTVPLTGYVWMLVDPNPTRSQTGSTNPDDDEWLVDTHKNTAPAYLRSAANLHAIEMVVGGERYAKLAPKLLTPASMDYERLVQEAGQLAHWVSVAEEWHKHAERVVVTDPEPEPLDDEVAEYLRRRTSAMLFQPKAPVGEEAAQAIQAYAYGVTDREVDWNVLTDAELIGYWLRRSEEELNDHGVIVDGVVNALAQPPHSDPKETLIIAATKVMSDMADESPPSLFSRDEGAWEALRSWAQDRALNNSSERRTRGLEKDEPTQVSASGADVAFHFGYALRAVEAAIYGEDD
jgi:hypothetical protein